MAVEQPAEHHADHRHRSVVGPAQAPPQFVTRFRLGAVIGHGGGARGMQPDAGVELFHASEDGIELRQVERLAGDVGIDQHAARAQRGDGAARLAHRAIHVGETQRRGKSGKALRVLGAQLGHAIVGDARELQPDVRLGDLFDRRVGQRDDLPVVAVFVHLRKARVKIEQLGDAAQARADILQLRCHLHHFREEAVGIDVAIDVDFGAHRLLSRARRPLRPADRPAARGGTCRGSRRPYRSSPDGCRWC